MATDRLLDGWNSTQRLGADREVMGPAGRAAPVSTEGMQLSKKMTQESMPIGEYQQRKKQFRDPYMQSAFQAGPGASPDKALVNVMMDHPRGPNFKLPKPPEVSDQPDTDALYGAMRLPPHVDPKIRYRRPRSRKGQTF